MPLQRRAYWIAYRHFAIQDEFMKTSHAIQMDPAVMQGKPTLRGTRVTVEVVLRRIPQRIASDSIKMGGDDLKMDGF